MNADPRTCSLSQTDESLRGASSDPAFGVLTHRGHAPESPAASAPCRSPTYGRNIRTSTSSRSDSSRQACSRRGGTWGIRTGAGGWYWAPGPDPSRSGGGHVIQPDSLPKATVRERRERQGCQLRAIDRGAYPDLPDEIQRPLRLHIYLVVERNLVTRKPPKPPIVFWCLADRCFDVLHAWDPCRALVEASARLSRLALRPLVRRFVRHSMEHALRFSAAEPRFIHRKRTFVRNFTSCQRCAPTLCGRRR